MVLKQPEIFLMTKRLILIYQKKKMCMSHALIDYICGTITTLILKTFYYKKIWFFNVNPLCSWATADQINSMVGSSCFCLTVQNCMLLHPWKQEGFISSGAEQVEQSAVSLKESVCQCWAYGFAWKCVFIYMSLCIFVAVHVVWAREHVRIL